MISYPIGVQNFEELRTLNALYIDKTKYIYQLIKSGKYYFLSRPRRFGKSLLLSTMKAFFEGKRELFKGLYIDSCDDIDWTPSPVIYIDLNAENYSTHESLLTRLDEQLKKYEQLYGLTDIPRTYPARFMAVIQAAYQQTGRQVVVLIDEYEKPILDTLQHDELKQSHRNLLAGFYSVLKSADQYLRFCFLTGVTQFGHLNIFSGLNNLQDISLLRDYSAICGITEEELRGNFQTGIKQLALDEEITEQEAYLELKKNYDGYHFSEKSPDIYNPFSLLNAFSARRIRAYWFKTGTPTFLVNLFREEDVDIREIEGVEVPEDSLYGGSTDVRNVIPLLYQTGYLTIKGYDKLLRLFKLGYPNNEVKRGFITALSPLYTHKSEDKTAFAVSEFTRDLWKGNIDGFMERLNSFFGNYPYEMTLDVERHFQNVIYVLTSLLGMNVEVERHTSNGRIDMVIKTKEYIYIFEFKRDQKPEVALQQIEEKGYPRPFLSDGRKIIIVGVDFSTTERRIAAWQAREV